MGVCGCGKTSVGGLLATNTEGVFIDADSFHPPKNVEKMSAGVPLNDQDRKKWLIAIGQAIKAHEGPWPLFFGCSALKRKYRNLIDFEADGQVITYIHLDGNKELIGERMKKREGHFMKAQMIDSQFQDLEKLQSDEKGITVNVEPGLDKVCENILDEINV
tara:strand:+ start:932 stop:1414 length:483 start_codon:yes stop_codon:yes gene_type:complete